MKLNVVSAIFAPSYGEPYYLDDSDFEDLAECPICLDRASSSLLGVAEGRAGVGLAVSICRNCHHAYHSRRPTKAWYQRYYAEEWDTGRTAARPSLSGRLKGRVKRVRALAPLVAMSRRLRGIPDRAVFRGRL